MTQVDNLNTSMSETGGLALSNIQQKKQFFFKIYILRSAGADQHSRFVSIKTKQKEDLIPNFHFTIGRCELARSVKVTVLNRTCAGAGSFK